VVDDGTVAITSTRRDADIDAFDPMLDRIDSDWRSHLTTWRDNKPVRQSFASQTPIRRPEATRGDQPTTTRKGARSA
jgi:hypothetical protein